MFFLPAALCYMEISLESAVEFSSFLVRTPQDTNQQLEEAKDRIRRLSEIVDSQKVRTNGN